MENSVTRFFYLVNAIEYLLKMKCIHTKALFSWFYAQIFRFVTAKLIRLGILGLFTLAQPVYAQSNASIEDLSKPSPVQDLAYGNILFEYYRGNLLDAMNAIMVAEKKGLLVNHQHAARLLAGVIYLDLGMLSHAQEVFNALLSEQNLKDEVLAKLEFYLGKLHYQQADFDIAEHRLNKVKQVISPDLKDESYLMLSNIAQIKGEQAESRQLLSQVREDSVMAIFSQYNLGISWLRNAELTEAEKVLTDLINHQGSELIDTELLINVQDKAKLALGYYYLSSQNYEQARQLLSAIRLHSMQSNKAILGVGWSYFETGQAQKALSYWLELATRDPRDIAVQEALLAIPYAFQKSSALKEALDAYLTASAQYQKQIETLDHLLVELDSPEFMLQTVQLLSGQFEHKRTQEPSEQDGSGQSSSEQGSSEQSPTRETDPKLTQMLDYYLYELIAENQFSQGFKGYQSILYLLELLQLWEERLPMMNEMVTVNQTRFSEKLPEVERYLSSNLIAPLATQIELMENQLQQLKSDQDLHLLADDKQLATHQRIQQLQARINRVSQGTTPENREALRDIEEKNLIAQRAAGILRWQIEENKAVKIWQLEKQLIQIKSAFAEIASRQRSLSQVHSFSKHRFAGMQQKISQQGDNLLELKSQINETLTLQIGILKGHIGALLKDRKQSLLNFQLQTDLAIARLHAISSEVMD